MPSFAQSLEKTLHAALASAAERHHEYATLEHLLLALVDDPDAAEVMQACGVDLAELGEVETELVNFAGAFLNRVEREVSWASGGRG